MKAIVYENYGSPENLKIREVDTPIPNDDQVLVKIMAVSINSWDRDLIKGKSFLVRLNGGFFNPKYKILGCDIAGRIEAVGKSVKIFKTGDDVLGDISGFGWGGFAEFVCVPEIALTIKPPQVNFNEAAAIPQAAVLALQSLNYERNVTNGEKILINGAGGGVGTYALQLAKLYGAEVTCVDCSEKMKMLKSLGSDNVIDFTKADFTKNGKAYDRIIDVVAKHSVFSYKDSLKTNGIFVMVGGNTTRILQTALLGNLLSKIGKNRTRERVKKLGLLIHKPNKDLNFLIDLIKTGKVNSIVDRCFSLVNTSEAFRYYESGKAFGKVIITV